MADLEVSERAAEAIRQVRASRGGTLTISIDSGCCEGTAPHLNEDYVLPYGSHPLGEAAGVTVYVPPHFKEQWEGASFALDVVDDPVSDALSLETELGLRLVIRYKSVCASER